MSGLIPLIALFATINGKPVSDADLAALVAAAPPELRAALSKTDELQRYYGLIDRLADEAGKDGLANLSPYRETLEIRRKMILAEARMDQFHRSLSISKEEQRAWYGAHRTDYEEARVKVIEPADSAGEVVSVRRSGGKTPAAIRDAVFALKPGEVSRPVQQPNGIWVVRLESLSTIPFEQVQGEIFNRLADARLQQWLAGVRASVTTSGRPPASR